MCAEVGESDDPIGATAQGDGVLKRALPCNIEHGVHPIGGKSPHAVNQPMPVQGGFGAQRGDIVLIGVTGGADNACTAGSGELDSYGSDRSCGTMDEQSLPGGDTEQVQDPRGCLPRHGECDGAFPVKFGGLGGDGSG
jgi:hypothetical protein